MVGDELQGPGPQYATVAVYYQADEGASVLTSVGRFATFSDAQEEAKHTAFQLEPTLLFPP